MSSKRLKQKSNYWIIAGSLLAGGMLTITGSPERFKMSQHPQDSTAHLAVQLRNGDGDWMTEGPQSNLELEVQRAELQDWFDSLR